MCSGKSEWASGCLSSVHLQSSVVNFNVGIFSDTIQVTVFECGTHETYPDISVISFKAEGHSGSKK